MLFVLLFKMNYFCRENSSINILMQKSMVRRLACALSFCALLISPSSVFSQQPIEVGYDAILSQDTEELVKTISHDSFQGRQAGEFGGLLASCYISAKLASYGVEPFVGDSYWQHFNFERRTTAFGMRNVLGVVPGETDEVVVIGAHYDHLGMEIDAHNRVCYNGADDNASGVAAVLQIAKAIKASGVKPYRTIIFALWDGEERGMLGSTYFIKDCPFIPRIKAYMNFDMVGRGPMENPRHLSYVYTSLYPSFGEWLRIDTEKRNFSFLPSYKAWRNPNFGSDNAAFADAGIPLVWYHTEGHPDYHKASDTSEKIDYPKLLDIIRAAYLCTWRLANEKEY